MYENIISLGNACKVASGLSRNGYRSFSGPFDWVVSDVKGVFLAIENNFKNYLKEDLLKLQDDSKENASYLNVLYNISFQHDFKSNRFLSEQINDVIKKYDKRIKNFFDAINKPTLFIRYISGDEEVRWLQENYSIIRSTLKKWNSENHIIFISNKMFNNTIFDVYMVTQLNENDGLYGFFLDENNELLEYLNSNYSKDKKVKNLSFYVQNLINNEMIIKEDFNRVNNNYLVMIKYTKFKQRGYSISEFLKNRKYKNIAIYGAGQVGKIVYEELADTVINVKCFIDMYRSQNSIFGIEVIKEDLNLVEVDAIIVTVCSEFNEIKESLNSKIKCSVISFDDIVSEFLK